MDGDVEFFRYEKLVLKYFGISTTDEVSIAYKVYSFVVVVVLPCLYSVTLSLDMLTQKLDDSLDSWSTFIGYLTILFINLNSYFKEHSMSRLLKKIGNRVFVRNFHLKDTVEHLSLTRWHRYKNIYIITYIITIFSSIGAQFVYSLTLRYTKTDPNDWNFGYGSISVVNVSYSPNFEIVYIYQSLSVLCAVTPCVMIMILITGTLNFIAVQFILLQNDVKEITSQLNREVKNFVAGHLRVLSLTEEITAFYSSSILALFVGITTINCMQIYRMSMLPVDDVRSIRLFLEGLVSSLTIFFICGASENIENENERLTNSIYDVDFVGTDLGLQKFLIVVMKQAQKPIGIKAGGLIDVSLITYTLILRASYSAYTMLKGVH